jgi:hypothetical protein
MRKLALYALSISAAIVFFAGCGGSQLPMSAPGAQRASVVPNAARYRVRPLSIRQAAI